MVDAHPLAHGWLPDTGATGGRQEVVYELTGSEVVFDPEASSPGFLKELARTIRLRFRGVERAYLEALGRAGTVRHGRRRNLSLHLHHARLRPQHRAELYRRIVSAATAKNWLLFF